MLISQLLLGRSSHPAPFSEVKFNSKTFLFSLLWPKNASEGLKIEVFKNLLNSALCPMVLGVKICQVIAEILAFKVKVRFFPDTL